MSAPPPQNLAAEESVLGAIMLAGAGSAEASSATIMNVRASGLQAGDFYRESHGLVYESALAVDERGEPADVLSLERELRTRRKLTAAGGTGRLTELAAIAPATANAGHYARLVVEAAERREQDEVGLALRKAAENGGGLATDPDLRERITRLLGAPRIEGVRLTGISNADLRRLGVLPTQEIVAGVIEAGTVGAFVGLPGTYKSFLANQTAHKVAGGGGLVLGREVIRQGPVGYWWQDDSTENEIRRIQAYGAANDYDAELPIRWHLNEGLRLPDDLRRLREEIEREQQVLAFLDSLYNFLPGFTLKDEEVAAVYAAIKSDVCDQTGATVAVVDHAPWPTEGNRGQQRAYGSVFKAAAIRWGVYLVKQASTLYVEARGNNLTGLERTAVTFDAERFELRVHEAPSLELDLEARIADFLARNAGAATTAVVAGVKGDDKAIRSRLHDSASFVTVPPVVVGRPRNATCWARVEDVKTLLDTNPVNEGTDVAPGLSRETK